MADTPDEPTWRLLYGEFPLYTRPETRVYLAHIPSCFTEERLAQRLRKLYGPVQIFHYRAGERNDGYAWVGFENEESVRIAIKEGKSPRPVPVPVPEKPPVAEEEK